MTRVQAHVHTKSDRAVSSSESRTRPNAPTLITDGVRGLYAARWAPVLASMLIVAQFGLLVWALGLRSSGNSGHPGSAGPLVSRSVPTAVVRLHVAFQDTAAELTIRTAIRELKGRVVDGPTADGVYTIEVPEAVAVDERVSDLRVQRQLFRSVERVKP
jgi:hypothetical protein